MTSRDERTRVMSEILNNIQSIKLNGWETTFSAKVLAARNEKELPTLRRIGIVQSFNHFFWMSTPFLVAFVTFASYAATSKRLLDSQIIFPAITLFQLLSFPMTMFANIVNGIIEANVSVGRVENFLDGEEIAQDARTIVCADDDPQGEPRKGDTVVTIESGEFRWLPNSADAILKDIALTMSKGELLAIVGRVADGKSSLLAALLGEMNRSKGVVSIRGSIAYFGQNPWILSATVKDNIVFGQPFDLNFYDKVLDACALRPDLVVFPQGDMTEVGERGVLLSGGQKARIALARTCYARADIYLLDDPLSAVDAHVGRHIFDHVIGPEGLLKQHARLLCTNATRFLASTDRIVLLRKGTILDSGSYLEAMSNSSSELYKFINGPDGPGPQTVNASQMRNHSPFVVKAELQQPVDGSDSREFSSVTCNRVDQRRNIIPRISSASLRQKKVDAPRDFRGSCHERERIKKGSVEGNVYRHYVFTASKFGMALFLVLMLVGQGSSILANNVLRLWARKNSEVDENSQIGRNLIAYGVIGLLSSVFTLGGQMMLKLQCGLRYSRKLHDESLSALIGSPLSFFELTPAGRILNLFSRDFIVIDELLNNALSSFVRTVSAGPSCFAGSADVGYSCSKRSESA